MPAFKLQARPKDFLRVQTIFDGLLALLSYLSSRLYFLLVYCRLYYHLRLYPFLPGIPSVSIKVSSHSSLIPLSAIKVSDGQSLISIEKSLFFPLKKSRIMNGIYFIYLMNYPLARIFVPSLKLAPGEIHLKFSGENRIN